MVADRQRAGADLLREGDAADVVVLAGLVRVLDERDWRPARWSRVQGVAEEQPGAAVLRRRRVSEAEGDAGLLEEAAEEGKVGLAVLDPVVEARVAVGELPDGGDLPLVEKLPGDLRGGEVLEDAMVRALREQPEPWDKLDEVGREPRFPGAEIEGVNLLRAATDARPAARPSAAGNAITGAHFKGSGLSDDGREVEVWVRGPRQDRDLED